MEPLARLLAEGEDWINQRVRGYAVAPGVRHPGGELPNASEESVTRYTAPLIRALTTPPGNGEAAVQFAVEQAHLNRQDAATLPTTLRLLKLQRRCCRELIVEAGLDPDSRLRYIGHLEDTFDRMEVALCSEWSALDGDRCGTPGGQDRLELLKALSDRVRAGLSAAQVIAFAVSELARQFAGYRVAYARLGKGDRLMVLQSSQPQGLADLSGEELDLTGQPRYMAELRSFMPVLSEDVGTDPLYGTLGDWLAGGGVGATVDLPIRSGQDLAGVLCVAARHPQPWDPEVVRLLTQVGEILNGVCEREARERAERALQETTLWLRSMFQSLEEAVFLLTPGRDLVDCNPAAERMFQYSRRELEYLSMEVLHLDRGHHAQYGAIMDAAFARGESAAFDYQLRRKDGEVFPAEQTVALLRGEGGEAVGILAVVRDVTERRRAESELRSREEQYRAFFEGNHAVMLVVDPEDGVVVDANPAAAEYYGYGIGEMTGMPITRINTLAPDAVFAEMEDARRQRRGYFLFQHRRADGTVRDVEVYSGPVQVRNRPMLFSIVHDITDRRLAERALQSSEERYRLIAESMSDYVYAARVESEGAVRTEWVTGAFESITGYSPEEIQVLDGGFSAIVHPEDVERVRSMGRQLLDNRPLLVDFRITRKDGTICWLRDHIRPLAEPGGTRITRLLGGVQDITERKLLEEELHALATTDPLTGVLNRRRFLDRAREEFQAARRYGRGLAVLMLDVDHFKRINDAHGHQGGDEVLRCLSRFCGDALRQTDAFGRIGGEEFAAVLQEAGPETALQAAERICCGLAALEVRLPESAVRFTVSGGLARLGCQDVDLEALMHRADEALYAAKRRGRNRVVAV